METMQSRVSMRSGSVGTTWKAPETFEGQYSENSDVFAFGVTMFEVISRCIPYELEGFSPGQIMKLNSFEPLQELASDEYSISVEQQRQMWMKEKPLHKRHPDLAKIQEECSRSPNSFLISSLLELIVRCWADEPDDRRTFTSCAAELRQLSSGSIVEWYSF